MVAIVAIFSRYIAVPTLNGQQFYLFGQFQTSQRGGPPNRDTSLYGECSLPVPTYILR